MLTLLDLLLRNARGRPRRSIGVCCDCYRYQPRRQSYWKDMPKKYPSELNKLCAHDYKIQVREWSAGLSYQCPDCWCEEMIYVIARDH
ncbi:hypothetical protein F4819DRAFT_460196 [Hypoxylon fuscum]|nr:hypothetical protein F4819DRAFT_460196 [Hypoxylon fuscum]